MVPPAIQLPGVEAVDRFRAYEIEYGGLPATIAGADTSVTRFYKTSGFLSGKSANDVIRLLTTGDNAVVSEPFAYKHKVRAGQNITVPLGELRVRLHVLDIYRDFSAEKGVIIVDRKTLLKYVPDPAASPFRTHWVRPRGATRKRVPWSSITLTGWRTDGPTSARAPARHSNRAGRGPVLPARRGRG